MKISNKILYFLLITILITFSIINSSKLKEGLGEKKETCSQVFSDTNLNNPERKKTECLNIQIQKNKEIQSRLTTKSAEIKKLLEKIKMDTRVNSGNIKAHTRALEKNK